MGLVASLVVGLVDFDGFVAGNTERKARLRA